MKEVTNKSTGSYSTLTVLEARLAVLQKTAKTNDKATQLPLAEIYKTMAEIYFRQSNYLESGKLYSQALSIYARLQNHQGLIKCQNAQASICLAKGDLAAAKSKLEGLLTLFKKHPDPNTEHIVLNNIGIVHEKIGDLPRAVLYYHRSLAIKYELNNPLLPTYTLHNLANIYQQVEDYDTAQKYNQMALDIIDDGSDLNAQATILNGIAQILSKKGQLTEAKQSFEKAMNLATTENNFAQVAQARAGLGHIEFKKRNFINAKKLLEKALEAFRKQQEQEYIVRCLIDLAKINQNQLSNDALLQIHEATRICKINGFRSLLASVYELNASINATKKEYKKAYYYQKLFQDLYKETHKTNILNQVEVNKLSIELENSRNKSEHFQKQACQLEHDSMHDHLTGAGNRRQLDRILADNWQKNSTQKQSNHLAMLDIDDFKKINDNFSHAIGDSVLQIISTIIKDNIREHDTFFRYGGEEFIILIKDNNDEIAQSIFNRIRKTIQIYDWNKVSQQLEVTATLGMVSNSEQPLIEKALKFADERMYYGKNNGKNKLVWT